MAILKSSVEHNRVNLADVIPLSVPFVLYVELSGFCNLKCRFCPHFLDPDSLIKANMSFEIFRKIVDDIEGLGRLKVLRLIGTGEPLLNKKFLEMVHYAKKSSSVDKLELTTNGILLKKEEYHKNLTKYLDRIIISIEGLDEQAYLDVAGTKINYTDLVENIGKLYENKRDCTIYIKIHNNALKNKNDLKLFHKYFGKICDEIYVENLVNLWPETISNLGLDSGHRFNDVDQKQTVCTQIFKSMMVNANGDVVPCCVDFKRVNNLGNVSMQNLGEIWKSHKLEEIRKTHLRGEGGTISPCSGCSYYQSDVDNIDANKDEILKRISS